jgi:hypothetical protein
VIANEGSSYGRNCHLPRGDGFMPPRHHSLLPLNFDATKPLRPGFRGWGQGDGSALYVTGYQYFEPGPGLVALTSTILVSHSIGISVTGRYTFTGNGLLWFSTPITISRAAPAIVMMQNQYEGDPVFASDGYHLTAGSAAIDRGVDTGVLTDIDGQPRPQGVAPDLGADEYVAPAQKSQLLTFEPGASDCDRRLADQSNVLARHMNFPPMIVASTRAFKISAGSISRISRSSTVKSASLHGVIEPSRSSMPAAKAAPDVNPCTASSTVNRCSGYFLLLDKTVGDSRIFVGAFPAGELAERIQAVRLRHDANTARITAPHVTVAGTYWRSGPAAVRAFHSCLRQRAPNGRLG